MKRNWIWLVLAINMIARAPSLWIEVINHDEAAYAAYAGFMNQGLKPYKDFSMDKPLGTALFQQMLFKLSGDPSLRLLHWVGLIINIAISLLIFQCLRRTWSERAGILGGILYALGSATYIPKYIATNIELFLNFFFVVMAVLTFKFLETRRYGILFVVGLCAGLSICFKYQAGIVLPIFGLLILLHFGIKKSLGPGVVFAGAAAIPIALMWTYVKAHGIESDYWRWSIEGSIIYKNLGSDAALKNLGRVAFRIGSFILCTFYLWLPFLGLWKIRNDSRARVLHFGLISFVCATAAVTAGWRLYDHYYLLWLPGLCFLGGPVYDQWWDTTGFARKRIWITTASIVILVGTAIPRYIFETVTVFFRDENPYQYKKYAEEVRKRTVPGDRISVWGFAPHIFYYSNRLPATRFDSLMQYLLGYINRELPASRYREFIFPHAWEDWEEDMKNHPPKYILDLTQTRLHEIDRYPISQYPQMAALIRNSYCLETDIDGVLFYTTKDSPSCKKELK